jgi:DNA-3-methyladenine glycosylase
VTGRAQVLRRPFYERSSLEVAPDLLHKVLVCGRRAVRVVEVEAYQGGDDPASHAYRGITPRNAVMFGRPGRLYVYFTYGMHWCANVVCGPVGEASAVLLRAGAPLRGVPAMRHARPAARTDRDLCRGPAKLCQALGIDGSFDGANLLSGDGGVRVLDDGVPPPPIAGRSGRVGIREAANRPWRWYVEGDAHVSRGPR